MQERYDVGGIPTDHAVDLARVEQARVKNSVPRVQTIEAEEIAHANRPSTQMLLAISATGKHLYQGTVSGAERADRRRRNKAARKARRANR